MDYQHRPGAKTGSGGVASWSETNKDRRERLRQLALETIDLSKDPYFMKNHLGTYECKLCLTLHNNEGSYLAHTQGKKHQSNLARRAAKEAKDSSSLQQMQPNIILSDQKSLASSNAKKKFVKIGRPGYKVTKQRDPDTGQCSLLFQIDYPEIAENVAPRHRFMSAYEQRVEPPDKKWQYLLFAAEPYETVSFKVPSREVDKPSVTGSNNNLNFGAGLMDFKGGRGSGASFVNFSDRKFWYLWNAQAKQQVLITENMKNFGAKMLVIKYERANIKNMISKVISAHF
ncbi:splicing factor 3A subunit 2-like isoform X2 [Gordionus sp. m RMFG-2023]|uniref:splicing factor 3A subunit 2-like isoform X2 n=1 Tax=Gordionus sp. m RMFG-2023 TaxID=3053472 RepID=UPI0031FE1947